MPCVVPLHFVVLAALIALHSIRFDFVGTAQQGGATGADAEEAAGEGQQATSTGGAAASARDQHFGAGIDHATGAAGAIEA